MTNLSFYESKEGSLGLELELQLININDGKLISGASKLLESIKGTPYEKRVKPELTQSMIEINSSIHETPQDLFKEMQEVQSFLYGIANPLGITFCGGGTHPFSLGAEQLIYPAARYQQIFKEFGFLCQHATVFGQHVHIGCKSPEDAIYLTHGFVRFIPQFIALSASSPFYQAQESGFESTRNTLFNSFPTSGFMPMIQSWSEFKEFFFKMKQSGVLETMKDIHWDVRPKPEFGTVEIRILDTPLSLRKAVILASYIQAIAKYLIDKKPYRYSKDLYFPYSYNRFLASRYGIAGSFIDPISFKRYPIQEAVLQTLELVKPYVKNDDQHLFQELGEQATEKINDAQTLKSNYEHHLSFQKMVAEQIELWKASSEGGL